MSLRLRLTLISTLVMAVLFAIFGTIAYFVVNDALYRPIDDVLSLRANTSVVYQMLTQGRTPDLTQFSSNDPLGSVYFTVYRQDGTVVVSERPVPTDPELVSEALEGKPVFATIPAGDGRRVRVLVTPIVDRNGTIWGALQAASPLDITDQRLSELAWLMAGTSGVLLVIATIGSYLMTGRALHAVERVTRKVQQIELSQDLTQRLPSPGADDELGHLVTTFNGLIEKLQASFEAQRRFIADSSHELRTPITVIKSNLHLLRRAKDPTDRSELIETSEAETSRLNRMVNDLLYMAQMQAGQELKPVLRPVELDSVLLEVFARARSIATLKNQKIVLAHEDIATSTGDRDQLQHLLLNLVDNALKYTQEGGVISLGLWKEGEWARIEVTDNGPGIPSADLPNIFDRFYRTPDARVTQRSGSGLGLSIVKAIAEAHGGRVEVFSRMGEGTTFRLWLPSPAGANASDMDDEPVAEHDIQQGVTPLPTRPTNVTS